jgi:thymidylate kinase
MAISKHIIIEGLPATGKTEISNVLKIYFPGIIRILPELTTVIVRENKFNILEDRERMTELLKEYLNRRIQEINNIKKEFSKLNKDLIIFEESHLGVHWAYSNVINDNYFLKEYENYFIKNQIMPDFFLRLYISPELSYQRQIARATPDVEVTPEIILKMFDFLKKWHNVYASEIAVNQIDADRSPDLVIKDILKAMILDY